MYSHTPSLTSELDGVGGQRHDPAALAPGKTRYPLYRRLGGHKGRSGRVRKISPHIGIRSPVRGAHSETLYRLSYPGPFFMQGIYNYEHATNHVCRVYSVATVLHLQFVLHVMLFRQ